MSTAREYAFDNFPIVTCGLFAFFLLLFFTEDVVMVPAEPSPAQKYGSPPFYPTPPHSENPNEVPPQNQAENVNSYAQQTHMPYPLQQQQPLNSY